MTFAPLALLFTVAFVQLSDAATTYNLALLQETLEVIGEDIVLFVTNKLNGGDNGQDEEESLYETADEQLDDEDEEPELDGEEAATSKPETSTVEEKAPEDMSSAEGKTNPGKKNEDQKTPVGVIQEVEKVDEEVDEEVALQPSTTSNKNNKFVKEIKETKSSLPKAKSNADAESLKESDMVNVGKKAEEGSENEEQEPDMAEALASVAIGVAAEKLKEQLAKLNIQLK